MPGLPVNAAATSTVSSAESTPLLRLDGVTFRRAGRVILDRAELAVGDGEIVTLIGPNGAGKSTLVKIALGLLSPDAGIVARAPNLRIGYVPQHTEFDPTLPLTVRRFLGLSRGDESTDAAAQALTQAGAADLYDAPMQALSGGEMRRVLLARALLRAPHLLILDEPGAGMDLGGQVELYRLFQTIRARRRCAILLVSHDLHMVMAATDRVFCLNRHLCCSGQPEDVRRHPEFVQMFGQRAAAELAVYQHHHDHSHDLHGDVRPADAPDGDTMAAAADDGDASAMADDGDGNNDDDGDAATIDASRSTGSAADAGGDDSRHG